MKRRPPQISTAARAAAAVLGAIAAFGSACATENTRPAAQNPSDVPVSLSADTPDPSAAPPPTADHPTDETAREPIETVVIDTTESVTFDRRLLGTNVPAWLGAERLSDPDFVDLTLESGTTLIRMPGGSWSNHYDFRACEVGDEESCFWPWAARPSDFADYLQATGLPGMWTASINQTAQHAAAAVAFFNGAVGDPTPIGVDRDGFDWKTVDTWARLRESGGNPEPVRIDLWEIGNEVYGGKPELGGEECASFGWEGVWTCSGTEYVEGNAEHDGYLAIRRAMLAVDDAIEIGAVGVPDPESWGNWGNEIIDGVGAEIDFYVVHRYGFDESPTAEQAVARPREIWPKMFTSLDAALDDLPIAITEYNLVSFDDGDTDASMTRALSGLYLADTIGQFALGGAAIANQWNLASGVAESGTNYGLIDVDDDNAPTPQFEALRMWSRAGTSLFAARSGDRGLRVYPTRHDDGRWSIIVINVDDDAKTPFFELDELAQNSKFELTSVSTSDLRATSLGQPITTTPDVTIHPPTDEIGTGFSLELPPYSINVVEMAA